MLGNKQTVKEKVRNSNKKYKTREFISVIKIPLVNILGSETMFPNYSPRSYNAMK